MSAAERDARITDTLRARAQRHDRSPGEVVVDRIWRFFCSVRVAVYEIIFLTLLVLVGTLKGSVIPAQLPKLVPALDPLVRRWYAFDVYHSMIFAATLALLAVAIVVCTVNRVPGIWNSIVHPTVRTTRQFFRSAEPAVAVYPSGTAATTATELAAVMKGKRYRVLTEQHGEAIHFYADKHRFGKLGTFPFHLALILVLVGGIVGARYGFRNQLFAVPEGSIRDVGYGTSLQVRLEDFVDTYSEIGAPTSYRSDIVLYDGGREVKRQSITVNHPMTYKNATFYQSSFGPAAAVRVTDGAGNVVYEDGVAFTYMSRTNMAAPAALLELPVQGLRVEMIYPNTKLNANPEIGNVKLQPGQMWVQARDWRTNQPVGQGRVLGQGETATLGGINFQFVRELRFTVMQVAYNPGIPILFAAAFLGVLGLLVTFGMPHRRVRALITERDGGAAEMLLAPMARRDWSGKREFALLLDDVERRFGAVLPHGRTAGGLD